MNEESLDPDVVERLLGLPPGLPAWQAADAASRGRVLATWLSSAALRGIPISEGAQTGQLDSKAVSATNSGRVRPREQRHGPPRTSR